MVECPNCKKQLDDGMNFCDSCGTPLPKIVNCPTCGTPMSKDLSNCPNCGAVNTEKNAMMGAPVPTPAPTPVAPTPVTPAPTPVAPTPVTPAPAQESGTISSGTISSGTISSGTISSGTISSGTISSGTISSGTIQSGTIGQPEPQAQPLGQTSFSQPEPQATPLQSEPFGQPQGQPMGQQGFGQPQQNFGQPQQNFGQPQQQWGQPQGQPAYGQPMGQQWGQQPVQKKSHKGLIIGIIIAVVLVIAGVFAFLFFTKTGPFKDALLEQLKEAEVGDTITYGKYEQDNDTSNGKEDITWQVLAKEDGRILVISEKAIEGQQFNSVKEATTWEKCSLRSFLNSTFISEAFEGNYQSRILESTVNADKNPSKSSVAQGNSTQDKVFLLSYSEMSKYLTSNETRKSYVTDYAYSKGVWKGDNGEACCWLRTMGTMDTTYQNATIVQGAGSLGYNGRPVNEVQSVRPAMWISTK